MDLFIPSTKSTRMWIKGELVEPTNLHHDPFPDSDGY
jgi:hypothetical protein